MKMLVLWAGFDNLRFAFLIFKMGLELYIKKWIEFSSMLDEYNKHDEVHFMFQNHPRMISS